MNGADRDLCFASSYSTKVPIDFLRNFPERNENSNLSLHDREHVNFKGNLLGLLKSWSGTFFSFYSSQHLLHLHECLSVSLTIVHAIRSVVVSIRHQRDVEW